MLIVAVVLVFKRVTLFFALNVQYFSFIASFSYNIGNQVVLSSEVNPLSVLWTLDRFFGHMFFNKT